MSLSPRRPQSRAETAQRANVQVVAFEGSMGGDGKLISKNETFSLIQFPVHSRLSTHPRWSVGQSLQSHDDAGFNIVVERLWRSLKYEEVYSFKPIITLRCIYARSDAKRPILQKSRNICMTGIALKKSRF
jgi:hypothetical protein